MWSLVKCLDVYKCGNLEFDFDFIKIGDVLVEFVVFMWMVCYWCLIIIIKWIVLFDYCGFYVVVCG